MAFDVAQFRKLLALDKDDPLSRYGLGQALFQEEKTELLPEAAEHLRFANQQDPNHLASYHVLAQVLLKLELIDEARDVLTAGCKRAEGIGECMGQDLGPLMNEMLQQL